MPRIEFTDGTRIDFNPNHGPNVQFSSGPAVGGMQGVDPNIPGTGFTDVDMEAAQKIATKYGGLNSTKTEPRYQVEKPDAFYRPSITAKVAGGGVSVEIQPAAKLKPDGKFLLDNEGRIVYDQNKRTIVGSAPTNSLGASYISQPKRIEITVPAKTASKRAMKEFDTLFKGYAAMRASDPTLKSYAASIPKNSGTTFGNNF